jgi:serine/threonine protein kinase
MPSKTRTFLSPANPANRAAEGDALLDGRYRIVRLLGEGGMGAVYLASHVGLGRDVAIKFLHAEFISREDIVGRFRREAQAAAAIRHKNIIEVFDVGMSPQGEPFLVMEYLEGESLAGLLKRVGPLSLGAACAVMEPTLQALQAAHRKGIVHRDLKPDNIFLAYQEGEPPVVKIIDFGISKFTQGDPDKWRTRTGAVMGTPAYMSPEQARGSASLDHRTDLYSMGTILFEMLTGGLPYAGTNFAEYSVRDAGRRTKSAAIRVRGLPRRGRAHGAQGPGQESRPALSERDRDAGSPRGTPQLRRRERTAVLARVDP